MSAPRDLGLARRAAERDESAGRGARLHDVFAALAEGVVILDTEARIVECNESAGRLLGLPRERILGRTLHDPPWRVTRADGSALPVDEHPTVVTLRTGETCTDVVVGIHAADGAFRWCSVNCRAWRASEGAAAHGVVASFSDITALRDLGGRLLEAQQLETVARLAGGIAHEFNNLLTVVLGCSELGLAQVEAHSKLAGYLTRIQESGDRAALLSGHLLALARRRPPVETRVDLGEWCASNLCVLRALLGPGVQVALERERTLWPVLADRMQLQQVLLTVASHAADAMTVGGHVKIRLANATLGPGADSPAGEYVEWSVADDGVGMAPELLAHLFEPSFGTKAVGEGRELGLASCHGIVRRLGGRLAVRSAPANGSTVTIHLPRARPIEAP